jgi:hypothetical protein
MSSKKGKIVPLILREESELTEDQPLVSSEVIDAVESEAPDQAPTSAKLSNLETDEVSPLITEKCAPHEVSV